AAGRIRVRSRWPSDPAGSFRSRRRRAGRRDVALPRAGGHPALLHTHVELVHLAVERLGREAQDVLAVQLLRDARERLAEIGGSLQLEVAAAGLLRKLLQAAIRLAAHPLLAVEV